MQDLFSNIDDNINHIIEEEDICDAIIAIDIGLEEMQKNCTPAKPIRKKSKEKNNEKNNS